MREKTGITDLQMRDIRRTVATGLGRLKVTPVTISHVLDHTIQGVGQVTHVYAKYDFLEEKRQALDLWSRHLVTVVKGKSSAERLARSRRDKPVWVTVIAIGDTARLSLRELDWASRKRGLQTMNESGLGDMASASQGAHCSQ